MKSPTLILLSHSRNVSTTIKTNGNRYDNKIGYYVQT